MKADVPSDNGEQEIGPVNGPVGAVEILDQLAGFDKRKLVRCSVAGGHGSTLLVSSERLSITLVADNLRTYPKTISRFGASRGSFGFSDRF